VKRAAPSGSSLKDGQPHGSPAARRTRRDCGAIGHVPADFSIKQPVTTVAIVIVLMVSVAGAEESRVNQIPDVDQP